MLSAKEKASEMWKKTIKALKDVKSSNVSYLQKEFLSYCRQFRTYGSTFFIAEVYMSQPHTSHVRAHCGVNDCGLHLISAASMTLISSYDHRELVWSFDVRKPYLEVQSRARKHHLTIRTPQAAYIYMLLNKLSGQTPPVNSTTPADSSGGNPPKCGHSFFMPVIEKMFSR
ncbi:Krev interaction trapped protein 1 [Trichostrongylus colubriformis]|uniref:Krev interaction trapped protein 1 n=1 Tax=Trichostrongylus colubriformis TaxID=6319 RepID=A0AAN8FMY7_TRICO